MQGIPKLSLVPALLWRPIFAGNYYHTHVDPQLEVQTRGFVVGDDQQLQVQMANDSMRAFLFQEIFDLSKF